jgi:glycerophosphoryl diester phosphodiesterase
MTAMNILAHRGWWLEKEQKNSLSALFAGLEAGYGLETDVRDLDGRLVISHDMPQAATAVPLDALLRFHAAHRCPGTLALNVKADGLQDALRRQLQEHGIDNYFVFDMSVPDTLGYLRQGLRTFVRRSDLEHHPALAARAQGLWLDELLAPWVDAEVIRAEAAQAEAVCLVSPELHGRPHEAQWAQIRLALDAGCPAGKLLLCTDFPQAAERFFK